MNCRVNTAAAWVVNRILIDPVTAVFCCLFLIAWTANAFKLTSFVMSELSGMYATIKTSDLAKHYTDSKLNSPLGEPPIKKEDG